MIYNSPALGANFYNTNGSGVQKVYIQQNNAGAATYNANYGIGTYPATIPALVLWLRSDLGVVLNGAKVSQLNDQSIYLNNVSNGSNQPTYNATDAILNSCPSFSSNGSNQLVGSTTIVSAQPNTTYVVFYSTWAGGTGNFIDSAGSIGSDRQIIGCNGAGQDWYIHAGTPSISSDTTGFTGTPQVLAAVFGISSPNTGSSTGSLYHNSSTVPVINNQVFGGNYLINLYVFNGMSGTIAEVIIFNAAHTQSQVASMFSYFATRYNGAFV